MNYEKFKDLPPEEQTSELCMAAVKQNGQALEYVKKQTPEICMAAVKQGERALEYVKNDALKKILKKFIMNET